MGYGERNSWAALGASAIGVIVYLALIVPQLQSTEAAEIVWFWPMLWTIMGAIALSIIASIIWGIVAGARHPEDAAVEDVRDKDIARLGSRVGQAFLVIAMLGALILAAVRADWFWIANTLYLGFALSAITDGTTRIIVYRTGMP